MPWQSRLILFVLVPIAALVLGLHVREVFGTGLLQVPVYASPGATPGDYPFVGGTTVEINAVHDLEVGDRLLQIGQQDLAGEGYIGFMGYAYEQADADGRVAVFFERRGERMQSELQLQPFAVPWLRVPFLAMMLLITVIVLARRPDTPLMQIGALGFCLTTIGEGIFEGRSYEQTLVAKSVFIFGGLFWWPPVVAFTARLPGDHPSRPIPSWLPAAMALNGLLFTVPKSMYIFGGPVPSDWIPAVVSAADGISVLVPFSIFVANYRAFDPAARRAMKWIIYSCGISGLAMFLALGIPVVYPDFPWFGEALAVAGISAAIIPLSTIVAIFGFDLFDFDRLLSATASYSLLLVVLLAALLSLVPLVGNLLASALGLNADTTRLVLSVFVAGMALPVNQWIQPQVDRYFFPERLRVQEGMEQLLAEQVHETEVDSLAEKLAERIHELFRPTFTAVFVEGQELFRVGRHWADHRPPDWLPLQLGEPLAQRLQRRAAPLSVTEDRAIGEATSEGTVLRSVGRDFLRAVPAALLLPIRERDTMRAFVAVGPKSSGDVYAATEIALLTATLEAAARHLDRAREAEALAAEKVRSGELDQQRRDVETAHLTRSRHLAAASHDLRQPLHALRLFAEALVGQAESESTRELAQRIQTSSVALHEMFDSLIDLSRMDQGTLQPELVAVEVRPLLARLCDEAQPSARARGLSLEVESCDATVHSDSILLARIVQNLLTNALRYTHEGSVRLLAREEGENVTISVEDTGPGIAPEQREAIFGEFVRLEPERSERGLGLGLSIVRRLAELLGHELRLESEVGRGSVFSLRVKRAAEVARPAASLAAVAASAFDGRRVLLVDDDLDVLAGMRALLEDWGAEVVLATNGEEAVESAESGLVFDAVLADYRLAEGETGPDVVAALRAELGNEIPALIITGSTSAEVADRLRDAGFAKLQKPVAPARLRAALSELLRGRAPAQG